MNSKAIRKQLLAAVAMVLVAAVALGSSTYAWFAGNNTVEAKGMSVKAQAESGILIKSLDNSKSTFSTTATAGMESAPEALFPTSTIDLSKWVHATSESKESEQSKQDAGKYTTLEDNALGDYVLKRQFAIRAASQSQAISGVQLAITKVEAKAATSNSPNLDKAVRVGVKVSAGGADGSKFYIYAPQNGGFELTAKYATPESGTAPTMTQPAAPSGTADVMTLANDTIPANDSQLIVDIYIWFEGEDPNCKSANITSADLDQINVSVTFQSITKS